MEASNTTLEQTVADHQPRRRGPIVVAVCLAIAVMVGTLAQDASATGGYSVSSGTWNVRNSVGGAVIGSVRGGQALDIACQVVGPAVSVSGFGTSTIYDRLNAPVGGFISDLAVAQTPYGVRDSRLPDCNQPAPPPVVTSRAEQAARWAEAHIGQVTTSENRNSVYWSGWCEAFAEKAWGGAFFYGSAQAHLNSVRGRLSTSTPPRGAVVLYEGNHVAISVGGGYVASTIGYVGQHLAVAKVPVRWFNLRYAGWYLPA